MGARRWQLFEAAALKPEDIKRRQREGENFCGVDRFTSGLQVQVSLLAICQ